MKEFSNNKINCQNTSKPCLLWLWQKPMCFWCWQMTIENPKLQSYIKYSICIEVKKKNLTENVTAQNSTLNESCSTKPPSQATKARDIYLLFSTFYWIEGPIWETKVLSKSNFKNETTWLFAIGWTLVYLIQKLVKPSSTPNDTPLKDVSHLYNICKTCTLEKNSRS